MKHSRSSSRRWIVLLASCTITLVTLLAYANALDGAWVLDDYPRIVENDAIKMDQLSLSRLWSAASSPPGSSRWVTNASFALNYYLHGLNPVGYAFVNIAVHILTALGLFFFLVLLLQQLSSPPERTVDAEFPEEQEDGTNATLRRPAVVIAWCTALLWAIHPVLTQSVNYTTQRSVLLCGLFYVWGLWAFLEWMQRDDEGGVSYLVIAILMGVLSVLSKEIGATFVLAALFVHWLSPRTDVTQRQYTLAGLGCLALFGLVSFYLLGGVDGTVQRLSGLFSSERVGGRRFTSWQRVMTEWRVMLFYLSLVLYPRLHRLNIEHEIDLSTGLLTPYTTGLSLVAILGLIMLAYRWRRRYPIMTFGVVWFFLHLSITSTVIPLELVFEHRVYLAAVGPVLVLVDLGYRRWPLPTFVQVGVLVALVVGLGWMTYQRNQVWQSTRSLYRDAVRKAPEKPRNHGNLGVAYAREARHVLKTEQDLEKAFTLMDRALRQHYRTMSLSKKQDRPIDRQFTSNIEPLLRDMTAIWSKLKRRTEDPKWTRRLLQWHKRFLFSMPPSYFRDRDAVRRQLSELRVFLAGVYLRQNEPGRARKLLKTVMDPDPARVDNALEQVEDPRVKRRLQELIHTIRARQREGDEESDHR